jgi:D-sedoheptulose 7-phosphate isomerase
VSAPERICDAAAYFSILEHSSAALAWDRVDLIARLLYRAYEEERTTYLFGNGGSASLASHFACDLGKGTWIPGSDLKRFRATALTDNLPVLTAWANDSGYEDVFAEQLSGIIQAGDIAFAISGSGNSKNVLKALHVAREAGALTIGIGGFEGGEMKALCDVSLIVPSDNMQIIEDLHLSIAHCLFTLVKNQISAANSQKVVAARAS